MLLHPRAPAVASSRARARARPGRDGVGGEREREGREGQEGEGRRRAGDGGARDGLRCYPEYEVMVNTKHGMSTFL